MVAKGSPHGCILMFLKAPVPGAVKTRMIPRLGAMGAASLARNLARTIAARLAEASAGWPVVLCVDDLEHEWVAGLAAEFGFERMAQGAGDLGERMARCATQALIRHDRVLIVGSDCPGYDAQYLEAARSALTTHDAVIGPAADGGYVLIGLTTVPDGLFNRIEWGNRFVFRSQCRKLEACGLRYKVLEERRDIDVPGDLDQLEGTAPFGGNPFTG